MKYSYVVTCQDVYGHHIIFTTLNRDNIGLHLRNFAYYFMDGLDYQIVLDNLYNFLSYPDQELKKKTNGNYLGGLAKFNLYVMENL
jgi:hypothetical protein